MVLYISDTPPPAALELVRKEVVPRDDGGPAARLLSAAAPQPIYTSTIDALLENHLTESARLTGWQYVLLAGPNADFLDGVVEVSIIDEEHLGGETRYGRAYAAAINQTIAIAEGVPGDYALRMLRVPSVYLFAVWLRNEASGDLLFPVPPATSALRAQPMYTEVALTAALRPLAEKRWRPDARG